MLRIPRLKQEGFTEIELLVAATVGLFVTGAAISLCWTGNRIVADLLKSQRAWQETRAAATLLTAELRGAGYDPTSTADAGISRAQPETLEFSADWNASGAVTPTAGNPNERLAYAVGAGTWKRGVNGGLGVELGAVPDPETIRLFEARALLASPRAGPGIVVGWRVARRNSPTP
jgi:Tfp pilus assembly protein PilW